MSKHKIWISLEYSNKETLVGEFERLVERMRVQEYRNVAGSGPGGGYIISGPEYIPTLTPSEVEKLRKLIQ